MIKAIYKSTILKQGYRRESDGSLHPYFVEGIIGLPIAKELYAEDETIAYELLKKWNNDPYYEFEMISVGRVEEFQIPRKTFFYSSVHEGHSIGMRD